MEEKIIKNIYVFDDNLDTVISFEASQKGLYDLLLKYYFAFISYKMNPTSKAYLNYIYVTLLYNKIFEEIDFSLELKNNKELKDFYNKVKCVAEKLYLSMVENNSDLDKLISYYILTINSYSYTTEYEFDNVSDYKKVSEIKTLSMDRVMGGISTVNLSELDEDATDEEVEEYLTDPDNELNEELILDNVYCYPIHGDFLHLLDEQLRLETSCEDLLNLVIYTEEYVHYFNDKSLTSSYKDDYDHLIKTLNSKKSLLKKAKSNYSNYYYNIKSDMAFKIEDIQTMYNNETVFINKVLSVFINRGDLNFFRELKALFVEFNIKNVDDCANLIKQFTDMLEENKMNSEINCLKNLIKNGNLIKFTTSLYNGFEKVTKSFIFNQKFDKYLDGGNDNHERK